MYDTELIDGIKTRLGITGMYHDELLLAYADDVKEFMISGGVPSDVVESTLAIGVIAKGVMDLWNFGSGEGQFSNTFIQRVNQLRYESVNRDV